MKYLTTVFMITLLLFSMLIMGCGGDEGDDNGDIGTNYPPSIEKIKAYGNEIKQGTSTPFHVYVSDFEDDPLKYTWGSTVGEFDTTSESSVTWTAPGTPGNVTITISVSDGQNDPVMRTISITVVSDTKPGSDILGAWDLVSIDGHYLPYLEEETIGIPTKHVSTKYTYKADGTYATYEEYSYIFTDGIWLIGDDMYSLGKSVSIACEYEVTGRYSITEEFESNVVITRSVSRYEVTDMSYDEKRYTDIQKAEIDDLFKGLKNIMQDLTTSSEPIELSIDGNEMRSTDLVWVGESLYKKILVTLETE